MLLWPTVAVLGFLVLAVVVIALATSSTERYEFERNQVQGQRRQAALPAEQAAPAAVVQSAADHLRPPAGAAVQEARVEQGTAVGLATHPAGRHLVEQGAEPAWWLVDDCGGQPGGRVVAGPFPDRIEADWAALSGISAAERAVYGVPRADGGVVRRQLPEERAWLAQLGDQLDRLGEEWDELLSDDDATGTLVVEVAAALVEAGLPVHDCTGGDPAGGVCLTPEPGGYGVLVSWSAHDRISVGQVHGAAVGAAVQRTLNTAVADCLRQFGFEVDRFGATGCCFVPTDQP